MDHDPDARYAATDPASELHLFLWTLGVPDAARRMIVQRVLALLERGREPVCTAPSRN